MRFQRMLLNFGARVGKLPQQALVAHNADIFRNVARSRRYLHQLKEICPAPCLIVIAETGQHIQHGDRIDLLRAVEHGIDGFKNAFVLIRIEIIRAHLLDHFRYAVWIDKHGAQQRLLRSQVLRHLPHKKLIQSCTPPFQ